MPADDAQDCPACGARSLRRERVACDRPAPRIDVLLCSSCGEWWFEAEGARMTLDTIRRLGLAG